VRAEMAIQGIDERIQALERKLDEAKLLILADQKQLTH